MHNYTSGPFFSIIVPTYNRSARLVKAIESILRQTFGDYEIIVVDDGSTDNTQKLVAQQIQSNVKIKYFRKANEERSIARNFGIAQSKGRYVGFLDSDDVVYSSHLQVAYDLLKRNRFPEVGHLGYEFIDDSGRVSLKRNTFDETYKARLIHENILHGNAIFIRNDIAGKVNFIPSKNAILSEDWYVWLRLAARFPFYFDNTITSAVIQHDTRSLLQIDSDKLISSTNTVVEYLKKDLPFLHAYKGQVSYHLANHYTFLSLTLALTKSRRYETIKYLLRAIQIDPKVVFRKRFLATLKHLA